MSIDATNGVAEPKPAREYKPIPVSEAERILKEYGKDSIIIITWDESNGLFHTTTFGSSEHYKHYAAETGEALTRIVGGNLSEKCVYEDFRKTT